MMLLMLPIQSSQPTPQPNEAYAEVRGPSEDTVDLTSNEAYSTATPHEVCLTAPNEAYGGTTGQRRADDVHQVVYEEVTPQYTLALPITTLHCSAIASF